MLKIWLPYVVFHVGRVFKEHFKLNFLCSNIPSFSTSLQVLWKGRGATPRRKVFLADAGYKFQQVVQQLPGEECPQRNLKLDD